MSHKYGFIFSPEGPPWAKIAVQIFVSENKTITQEILNEHKERLFKNHSAYTTELSNSSERIEQVGRESNNKHEDFKDDYLSSLKNNMKDLP